MAEIAVAERDGVGADGAARPTEDHVAVLDNAVVILDGATSPHPDLPPGGWYASLLVRSLSQALSAEPEADLAALLAGSIADVARREGLEPGHSPSSTVSIARWTDDTVDGLVLADSPIIAFGPSGADPLTDDRLATLRDSGQLRTGADVRAKRNAPGGFWVAEAEPKAATEAVRRSWPRSEVEALLLATDGVAIGVDEYGLFGWPEVLAMSRKRGPDAVLDAVRTAEKQDPDGERWPRAKRHDDQLLVVVELGLAPG
ncbi:protein phosphatase 2C domain-containing protein [Amycolatopsis sp. BJA-103]|uniref:protein phosphatase 2C domain-containing protein n=1 Tax=Amycolatopsis sp. BJA-103 TaxID=1911175 RepID=UPI000C791FC0|nr:protein phosphatase 2C domain-containing protein [Amycolatopsis sp. BJA-103]AUI63074.1 hypothetical protein BKN51_36310 [Amycolatopsis sp. BJA-103]PNE18918.1 hypothetical protein B1H26_14010 [Amycolatopsis sp. BJA-103]